MKEKFLAEFYIKNDINGEYVLDKQVEFEDAPSDEKIRELAAGCEVDRIRVSKIYDFESKTRKVMFTYSDATSELFDFDKLDFDKIKQEIENGNSVLIQRFEPTWE